MALSGSYDFSLNRNEVIKKALEKIGVFRAEDTMDAYTVQTCKDTLNLMLKQWQMRRIGLWLQAECALFFESGKTYYNIGPSGDHATSNFAVTTTSAAASSGDSTITVSATDGFADTYNIGIVLDDGTIQWTTQSGAVSGSTVTLAAALTDDVASGNNVYVYETKMQRPKEVTEIRYIEASTFERPVDLIGRHEYMRYTNKSYTGKSNEAYYLPELTNSKLFLWPIPDNRSHYLKFTARSPIQDLDVITDDLEVPQEWLKVVIYNLAIDLAPNFGKTNSRNFPHLELKAAQLLEEAISFDNEDTPLSFQPDLSDYS